MYRKDYSYGIRLRARILTTVGDSTSQKFLLIGQIGRNDQVEGQGRYAAVFLDFATLDRRKCGDSDFEDWIARSSTHECLMGHKVRVERSLSLCIVLIRVQQSYRRRKADANCYVGEKFRDPVPIESACAGTAEDYEW